MRAIMVNKSESRTTILQLHFYAMRPILEFLPLKDLISFASTCKTAHKTVRQIKLSNVDLRDYYDVNVKYLLTTVSFGKCIYLNLNHCYWLTPDTILNLLKQTNVKHLHIIECNVTTDIIEKVQNLNLSSLSISWSNNWFYYLQKDVNNISIQCFRNLKYLEIFYPFSTYPVHYYVNRLCKYVLQRCNLLENLKLYEYPYYHFCTHSIVEHAQNEIIGKPNATPLHHLKFISIDFINCQNVTKCIAYLLEAILPENGLPLQNVNLGKQSIPLLKEGIPGQQLQLLQKSTTFALSSVRCFETKPLLKELFWKSKGHVQSMFAQPNYKHFIMKHLHFDDFMPIARTIVEKSKNTIEMLDLAGCQATQNLSLGLHFIVRSCSRLTFLDLTVFRWNFTNYYSDFLLEAIANLTYLERLHLTPFQLGCKKNMLSTNNPMDHHPNIPSRRYAFWKVTSRCKNLNQIRIVNHQKHVTCIVHEETLAYIALCENLKELHLVNFSTFGKQSALPKITADCTLLETLYINNIENNVVGVNITAMEKFLINAKSLKQLSFIKSVPATKKFIDALCQCEKLEKINIDLIEFSHMTVCRLEENLHKLKNLWSFRINDPNFYYTDEPLIFELKRRQQSSPAFSFKLDYYFFMTFRELLKTFNLSPFFKENSHVAHFHLQQYSFLSF